MNKRYPIIVGLIFTLIALLLLLAPNKYISNVVQRFENIGYDLQVQAKVFAGNKSTLSPIAIVYIDDKSLQAEGRWPWSRAKLALLVDQLFKMEVAVVAFDVIFSEPEQNIIQTLLTNPSVAKTLSPASNSELQTLVPVFDVDRNFANSLQKGTSLLALGFLPMKSESNQLPPPILTMSEDEKNSLSINHYEGYLANVPLIQKAHKASGFINFIPDKDGVARRAPLIVEYHNGIYPSLALAAALLYLNENSFKLVTKQYSSGIVLEGVALSSRTIPTDANGQILIPYIGKSFSFPNYSATDIMHGRVDPLLLRDKIVFIGTSAVGLVDLKATPFEASFPGVEAQATIANGILENNFISAPPWGFGAQVFLTLLLGLIATFGFPYLNPKVSVLLIVLVPLLLIFSNNYFWNQSGYVISLMIPIFVFTMIGLFNIIYGYLFERKRSESLKAIFSEYVPKEFINQMIKMKGDYGVYGESRNMTVLFADIRNFSTISESMEARTLVSMLTEFFTPMTEIIFNNQGTIDKYVGDEIIAFWSAPITDVEHAKHALLSALQMQRKILSIQEEIRKYYNADLLMGIGLNTGLMNVGNMGSVYRRNYTILGDAVNLGSRIESLTKYYGVSILASEHTCDGQIDFIFRKVDKVMVKGRHQAIDIFEVICLSQDASEALLHSLAKYNKGLIAYYSQRWEEALDIFQNLQQKDPHKLYEIYIKRIHEFQEKAPPQDWDGTFMHQEK